VLSSHTAALHHVEACRLFRTDVGAYTRVMRTIAQLLEWIAEHRARWEAYWTARAELRRARADEHDRRVARHLERYRLRLGIPGGTTSR
jgi:hypothetical protein